MKQEEIYWMDVGQPGNYWEGRRIRLTKHILGTKGGSKIKNANQGHL